MSESIDDLVESYFDACVYSRALIDVGQHVSENCEHFVSFDGDWDALIYLAEEGLAVDGSFTIYQKSGVRMAIEALAARGLEQKAVEAIEDFIAEHDLHSADYIDDGDEDLPHAVDGRDWDREDGDLYFWNGPWSVWKHVEGDISLWVEVTSQHDQPAVDELQEVLTPAPS